MAAGRQTTGTPGTRAPSNASLVDFALSFSECHRRKGKAPVQTLRADFPHTAYRWSFGRNIMRLPSRRVAPGNGQSRAGDVTRGFRSTRRVQRSTPPGFRFLPLRATRRDWIRRQIPRATSGVDFFNFYAAPTQRCGAVADTRGNMSLPRQVLPNRSYMITRRCTQRQFLLRPDEYRERKSDLPLTTPLSIASPWGAAARSTYPGSRGDPRRFRSQPARFGRPRLVPADRPPRS